MFCVLQADTLAGAPAAPPLPPRPKRASKAPTRFITEQEGFDQGKGGAAVRSSALRPAAVLRPSMNTFCQLLSKDVPFSQGAFGLLAGRREEQAHGEGQAACAQGKHCLRARLWLQIRHACSCAALMQHARPLVCVKRAALCLLWPGARWFHHMHILQC